MAEELNEGCGCEGTADNIRTYNTSGISKYSQDPLVGKRVSLIDGRSGMVDDSIRNNTGEVIGYVIEGERGNYRVFKNKICGIIDEQEMGSGDYGSLEGTPGMGDPHPPTRTELGSGDKFPTLTAGTPAAKKRKKVKEEKREPHSIDTSVMDFKTFLKNTKLNQDKHH